MKFYKTKDIWPFVFFFLSGFCGLLYQVVWLRLAFRSFGVITPVLSVVVSVFMLGLALGSWVGGPLVKYLTHTCNRPALFFYGLVELLIGIGSLLVPYLFLHTEHWLFGMGQLNSTAYLINSALLITVNILPWCFFMGLTYPFMMAQFGADSASEHTSFSFLYLANVVGAMIGTLLTAYVLIEVLGFTKTLYVAGLANLFIAVVSIYLSRNKKVQAFSTSKPEYSANVTGHNHALLILFITGFSSIALEVVWTRAFTAVLETTVYAFASLVATYLLATWAGSYCYRRHLSADKTFSIAHLLAALSTSAFFPIIFNDPRVQSLKSLVLFSVVPMSAVLGYLTPLLVDRISAGNPQKAGRAYSINILGCIVGPLLASYFLLPLLGSKLSMLFLGLPFLALLLFVSDISLVNKIKLVTPALVLVSISAFVSLSYEERFLDRDYRAKGIIRRDHTATVISYGTTVQDKHLYVNGVGITILNTTTKWMAHLPLAHLQYSPKNALVICFGMGTTYRALLRWPQLEHVTAVELVPSVKEAFSYYHADANAVINDKRGEVIVDDGRRFLRRTRQQFDLITLDPPPPIQAAGSGMLYADEFVKLLKEHLSANGILAHWIPFGADPTFMRGATAVINDHFKFVRYFVGPLGTHFLASDAEIPMLNADELVKRLPEAAQQDIMEWESDPIKTQSNSILALEKNLTEVLGFSDLTQVQRSSDDYPLNEYYKVRDLIIKLKRIKNVLSGKSAGSGL